jgi:hypothetical protein
MHPTFRAALSTRDKTWNQRGVHGQTVRKTRWTTQRNTILLKMGNPGILKTWMT